MGQVGQSAIPVQATRRSSSNVGMESALRWLQLPVVSLEHDGIEALRHHIAHHTPVLITDLAASSPALQRWSPEFLSAHYGHKIVRVYDASFGTPGKNYMGSVDSMPFADFLRETLGAGRDLRMFLYNVGRQIPELLDDLEFPDVGLQFSRRFVYTFFGCKGSTTPLHFDIDMGHVLHTAMHGRRRVRLFAPDQSRALYQHPFTVRSYVNLDEPDLAQHPALACARGYEIILEPGQTLFMPSGYWHEFHYLEAGFGLSLRAGSSRLRDRVKGVANLLVLSPVDRLNNKLAARSWFAWKERQAQHRATADMNNQGL
jgi:Cupin-like domain